MNNKNKGHKPKIGQNSTRNVGYMARINIYNKIIKTKISISETSNTKN